MKLEKFSKRLLESELSKKDNSAVEKMKTEINNYIRDENLDELDSEGIDFLKYTNKLKDEIDRVVGSKSLDDPEVVRDQLYRFYDIK